MYYSLDHELYFKAADFGGKILLQRAIGLIPRPGGNQLKLYAYFETLTKVQSAEIICIGPSYFWCTI